MSGKRLPHALGKYARALHAAGFVVERTNGGHVRITAPDGSVSYQTTTPGNRAAQERWLQTALARGTVANSKNGGRNGQDHQARH